jgi:predicted nucleotidyltransferase
LGAGFHIRTEPANACVSDPDSRRDPTAFDGSSLRPGATGCNDRAMDDWVTVAIGLLNGHPAVKSVEFAGSRSRGTHEQLSDWDFAVETSDFDALARDLPALVAPLVPLGQQWEPMGHFPVYQVFLRGPTKIEYLFLDRKQDPLPPLEPSRETLRAINTHFWDWIWWLTTKASVGRNELVAEHMPQLYEHLLRPMGISAVPASIESAIEVFVARRNALEEEFGISVDRALETEVRKGIDRVLGER